MFLRMPPGHFGQVQGHGSRVGVRQDEADEFPVVRADTAKDMGIFPHPMGGHFGAASGWSPAADRIAHPPKAGFVFKQQAQGAVRVPSRHGGHLGLKFF